MVLDFEWTSTQSRQKSSPFLTSEQVFVPWHQELMWRKQSFAWVCTPRKRRSSAQNLRLTGEVATEKVEFEIANLTKSMSHDPGHWHPEIGSMAAAIYPEIFHCENVWKRCDNVSPDRICPFGTSNENVKASGDTVFMRLVVSACLITYLEIGLTFNLEGTVSHIMTTVYILSQQTFLFPR